MTQKPKAQNGETTLGEKQARADLEAHGLKLSRFALLDYIAHALAPAPWAAAAGRGRGVKTILDPDTARDVFASFRRVQCVELPPPNSKAVVAKARVLAINVDPRRHVSADAVLKDGALRALTEGDSVIAKQAAAWLADALEFESGPNGEVLVEQWRKEREAARRATGLAKVAARTRAERWKAELDWFHFVRDGRLSRALQRLAHLEAVARLDEADEVAQRASRRAR